MNTLASDMPRAEDRRVCHHSLLRDERACMCVSVCVRLWLASGRVTLTWIDSAGARVTYVDVFVRKVLCVLVRGCIGSTCLDCMCVCGCVCD